MGLTYVHWAFSFDLFMCHSTYFDELEALGRKFKAFEIFELKILKYYTYLYTYIY